MNPDIKYGPGGVVSCEKFLCSKHLGHARLTQSQWELLVNTCRGKYTIDWGAGPHLELSKGIMELPSKDRPLLLIAIEPKPCVNGGWWITRKYDGKFGMMKKYAGYVLPKPHGVSILSWPPNNGRFVWEIIPHLEVAGKVILIGQEIEGTVVGLPSLWEYLRGRELLRCIRSFSSKQFIAVYGAPFTRRFSKRGRFLEERAGLTGKLMQWSDTVK